MNKSLKDIIRMIIVARDTHLRLSNLKQSIALIPKKMILLKRVNISKKALAMLNFSIIWNRAQRGVYKTYNKKAYKQKTYQDI